MKTGSQTGKQQVIPLSPGGHLLSGGLALSFGVPGIEGKLGETFYWNCKQDKKDH